MKPIRLETTSVDGTKINLEALYQIAPSCFTEKKDEKTGEIKRVVNLRHCASSLAAMYSASSKGRRAICSLKRLRGWTTLN